MQALSPFRRAGRVRLLVAGVLAAALAPLFAGCSDPGPLGVEPVASANYRAAARCGQLAATKVTRGRTLALLADATKDAYRPGTLSIAMAKAIDSAVHDLAAASDAKDAPVPVVEVYLIGSTAVGADLRMPVDFPAQGDAVREAMRRQAVGCVQHEVAQARAARPGTDLLGRLDRVAANHPAVLVVDSNGLSNVAPLDLRRVPPLSVPARVAARLTLPDLRGTTVVFQDLGVTADGTVPQGNLRRLVDVWLTICRASGGTCSADSSVASGSGAGGVAPAGAARPAVALPEDPVAPAWWKEPVVDPCSLQLEVSGSALFVTDSAQLLPGAEADLAVIAARLQASPNLSVVVRGHTADDGVEAGRMRRSRARADRVKAWLVGHGVAAGRVRADGVGAHERLVDDTDAAGRLIESRAALNRRVQVIGYCPAH